MEVNNLLNTNTSFSQLSSIDKVTLMRDLVTFEIPYRYNLGIPNKFIFGLELEYENVSKAAMEKLVSNFEGWMAEKDISLDSGGEIISPELVDEEALWQYISVMASVLNILKVSVNHNAGLHVSVGTHVLGKDLAAWLRFIKVYLAYERVLVRFAKGDSIKMRDTFINFARPIGHSMLEKLDLLQERLSLNMLRDYLANYERNKDNALNFRGLSFNDNVCLRNSFELRLFNSSAKDVIIQNDINATVKMVMAAVNGNMNMDVVDERIEKLRSLNLGEMDYIKQGFRVLFDCVLEFVDLIFTNDLDKMCFLKQYMGELKIGSWNMFVGDAGCKRSTI